MFEYLARLVKMMAINIFFLSEKAENSVDIAKKLFDIEHTKANSVVFVAMLTSPFEAFSAADGNISGGSELAEVLGEFAALNIGNIPGIVENGVVLHGVDVGTLMRAFASIMGRENAKVAFNNFIQQKAEADEETITLTSLLDD